jgi:hypothetical protein
VVWRGIGAGAPRDRMQQRMAEAEWVRADAALAAVDATTVDGRLRGSSGCDRTREWGNVIVLREVVWAGPRAIKRSIGPSDAVTLSLSFVKNHIVKN